MRESIKVDMSPKYTDAVTLPGIVHDYQVGFSEMILLNEAYAVMLADRGILDRQSADKIVDGLKYVEETLKPGQLKGEWEDFYFNVERPMFQRIGSETGGRLHCGRSRNDIHATIQRMEIRKTVWPVLDELLDFQKLLLEKAAENTDAVMTGYTHWQPGQPITLGYYYMAVFSGLSRDFRRIKSAYENLNQSPYGAAAFAGTGFDIDRQQLSDLLGFDSVMENCLDSIAAKDYIVELLAAYSALAVDISRMAEDMYFWATFENGILELGGEVANCSSIMPQKRNPTTLEQAKSKSSHVIGNLMAAITTLKSAPYTNVMDIFETPTPYFESLDQLHQQMVCISETVKYTKLRRENAVKKASENLCTVTSLADHWVKKHGISFTQAHDIVGNIVSIVLDNGKLIPGITPELVRQESKKALGWEIEMTERELQSVLDPSENVQSKVGFGGPSTASVERMIETARKQLEEEAAWTAAAKAHVAGAYAALEQKVAALKEA